MPMGGWAALEGSRQNRSKMPPGRARRLRAADWNCGQILPQGHYSLVICHYNQSGAVILITSGIVSMTHGIVPG